MLHTRLERQRSYQYPESRLKFVAKRVVASRQVECDGPHGTYIPNIPAVRCCHVGRTLFPSSSQAKRPSNIRSSLERATVNLNVSHMEWPSTRSPGVQITMLLIVLYGLAHILVSQFFRTSNRMILHWSKYTYAFHSVISPTQSAHYETFVLQRAKARKHAQIHWSSTRSTEQSSP